MKLFAAAVVRCDLGAARVVAFEMENSHFGFIQRGSVREYMLFFARTIAERTARGVRMTVEENDYVVHCFCSLGGLAALIVADREYPVRVAFALIARILEDFARDVPRDTWLVATERIEWPPLRGFVQQYQDPAAADPIMRVQRELDETKVVLHRTMESLMQRGERLDDLVARSEELSIQSKTFFKTAERNNACCVIQ